MQIVAALSERVAELSLFQRTAQWIMPQENPVYSAEERALFRRAPDKMRSMRAEFARAFVENFSDAVVDVDSPQLKIIEDVCLAHLESHVVDPALRERLRPTYRAACKRLVISSDFYPAMQRPNVQLVTEAIGCDRTQRRAHPRRRLHEIDVLVFATGFHTDRFVRPMQVVGPEGVP